MERLVNVHFAGATLDYRFTSKGLLKTESERDNQQAIDQPTRRKGAEQPSRDIMLTNKQ